MPGANCSVVNCGTSHRQKNVAIFNLPSNPDHSEWRKQILHFTLRDRQIDADFKRQIDQNKFHICQKPFDESQYEHVRKLYIMCVNFNFSRYPLISCCKHRYFRMFAIWKLLRIFLEFLFPNFPIQIQRLHQFVTFLSIQEIDYFFNKPVCSSHILIGT